MDIDKIAIDMCRIYFNEYYIIDDDELFKKFFYYRDRLIRFNSFDLNDYRFLEKKEENI